MSKALAPLPNEPSSFAGERRPARSVVHPVERPLDAPLGGGRRRRRLGETGAGGLLEAHRHAGVAGDVVATDVAVRGAVVAVQPGAVVTLVANEPAHRGIGRGVQLGSGRIAALLGLHHERSQPAEHEHPRQHAAGDDSTDRAATSR